ncbi:MAG: polysaccharide deacetylase family protein [Pseudonocardiaceae bacterium]
MTEALVLCYHAVSPSWTAALSVTPDALERQLASLLRRGWQSTTFTEAVLNPPAKRTLAVTFDDAYTSVRDLAEPILSALGMAATVFAPTAFMSHHQLLDWDGIDHWHHTPTADELTGMDWGDLAGLADRGWEIGSHTRTHPHLPGLDESTLRHELETSLQECRDHLGRPCRSIAYPYGDVDARVAQGARAAGYIAGAALPAAPRGHEPLRWPRVGIYHADDDRRFGLKMNPVVRHLRSSRLWLSAT